jgi:hypothetical protein
VFFDQPLDLRQLPSVELIIGRQLNRVKPEIGLIFTGFDMDVRRSWLSLLKKKNRNRPTRNTVGIAVALPR